MRPDWDAAMQPFLAGLIIGFALGVVICAGVHEIREIDHMSSAWTH